MPPSLRRATPKRSAINAAESGHEEASDDRQKHLPETWQEAIDHPLYFKRHSEYEICAERWPIFRAIATAPGNAPRGFHAISPDMPR